MRTRFADTMPGGSLSYIMEGSNLPTVQAVVHFIVFLKFCEGFVGQRFLSYSEVLTLETHHIL